METANVQSEESYRIISFRGLVTLAAKTSKCLFSDQGFARFTVPCLLAPQYFFKLPHKSTSDPSFKSPHWFTHSLFPHFDSAPDHIKPEQH